MHTILVIEDDSGIRELLRDWLETEGYRVLEALGLDAAIVATQARPDAILLDLMLPVISGSSLLAAFTADPRTAAIPVIVMTAIEGRSDTLLGLGAYAVFQKPMSMSALVALLGKAIAEKGKQP